MADWQPETLLGQMLGPYEVLEELGRGGMAVVFKARQPALERDLALKVLRPDVAANRELKSRFHREAEAMASLNHANIVKVLDRGEADGLIYFAMEWVDGPTLKQVLQDTKISVDQLFAIATHTASALAHAHAQGIVHRDVKPANVLWEPDTQLAKVVDFGIARVTDPEAFMITLTQVNASLGTLDYMAPEQKVSAGEVDARADTYALGVMLYEMFVGFRPAGRFKLPSELNPNLPTRLDDIVSRCLEPDPQDRYPNMNEVVNDLNRAQARFGSARWLERDPHGNALRSSQINPALSTRAPVQGAHPLTWLLTCSVLLAGLATLSGVAYLVGPWRGKPDALEPTTSDDPSDLPPVDPPVEPVEPPVDPPVEPPVDPPVEPPVEPVEPPVDPPVDPVEPPVEPPVDPPVEPVEPPVDPPVDPVKPPVEPPVDPPVEPVEPPVDLDALRSELSRVSAASDQIGASLHLSYSTLSDALQRAKDALEERPGDANSLHAAEAELRQRFTAAAEKALDGTWKALAQGTLPEQGILKLATQAPRDCSSLESTLLAAEAYASAESTLRKALLEHATHLARQQSNVPQAVTTALATAPGPDPRISRAYEEAYRLLLKSGPAAPTALIEEDQKDVMKVERVGRAFRRPFLWPEDTKNGNTPAGEIVALCAASKSRCAVIVGTRFDSWLTLARVARTTVGPELRPSRIGLRLDAIAPSAIAPGGVLPSGNEAFYLASKNRVHRLVLKRRLATRGANLGFVNQGRSRFEVSDLEFAGQTRLRGEVLALSAAPDGSLYVLTSEKVWRWSPTHEAQYRSHRVADLGGQASLIPLPATEHAEWRVGRALLCPPGGDGASFLFEASAVSKQSVPLSGARAAASTKLWCVFERGKRHFSLFDGVSERELPRVRQGGAELKRIRAIAISGGQVYVSDDDGDRMTVYRLSYE